MKERKEGRKEGGNGKERKRKERKGCEEWIGKDGEGKWRKYGARKDVGKGWKKGRCTT